MRVSTISAVAILASLVGLMACTSGEHRVQFSDEIRVSEGRGPTVRGFDIAIEPELCARLGILFQNDGALDASWATERSVLLASRLRNEPCDDERFFAVYPNESADITRALRRLHRMFVDNYAEVDFTALEDRPEVIACVRDSKSALWATYGDVDLEEDGSRSGSVGLDLVGCGPVIRATVYVNEAARGHPIVALTFRLPLFGG